MESASHNDESPDESAPQKIVGVPRRYGVGTLLLITAMYAVLFSVLRCLQVPLGTFLLIVAFFTLVGLGQMFFFKGREPQAAAALVGIFFWPLAVLANLGLTLFGRSPFPSWLDHPGLMLLWIVLGGMAGSFAGAVILAVFTVAAMIKRPLAARRLRIKSRKRGAEDES